MWIGLFTQCSFEHTLLFFGSAIRFLNKMITKLTRQPKTEKVMNQISDDDDDNDNEDHNKDIPKT